MLEIEKLEREWRKYRAKRLRPLILSIIALLMIGAGFLFFPKNGISISYKKSETVTSKGTSPSASETGEKSIEKNVQPESHVKTVETNKTEIRKQPPMVSTPLQQPKPVTSAQNSVQKKESSVTLNPDTDFLESFSDTKESSDTKQKYAVKSIVKHETIAAPPQKSKNSLAKKREEKDEESYKAQENIQTSGLTISSSKQNNTLEYLIKRFNERRDPKLASYIAQSFYKKGKYKEAVKWSVMANSLDPSGEETWLVFARAKVQLGQKEDAIKALKVYLNQYNSRNVKSFLNSLESAQ